MQPPSSSSPLKHDPYAAFRSRGYPTYLLGWVLAILGQQIASVALRWDIYQRTGSAMSLGWVGLVQAIPVVLLALPAGQLADRFDRRKLVIFTQLLVAASSLGLAMVSHGQGAVGWMYAIIGLSATAAALGGPARAALLPQIVPTAIFANAVTWNSSFFQIASVIGPAAGGLIVYRYSPMIAYLADATMALVFAGAMIFLHVEPVERSKEPPSLRTLTEGIRFIWKNQIILATITLDLFAVLLGGAVYLLPIFADQLGTVRIGSIVMSRSLIFGWLQAAPAIGAFIMALVVAHLPPMKNAGRSMLLAVAGFGAATIVFGFSHWFWLSFVMLALTGAFDNISVVVRHTLVQVLAPDSMRGRISAVNNVFIGASNELGGFESGLTARLFGPLISVVGGGIGTIFVVAMSAFAWPELRRFGALHEARPIEPSSQGFEVLPAMKDPASIIDAETPTNQSLGDGR